MKCIVAIIGPTAVGKSQHTIRIARKYNGEIINADSRQIYRHMNIGTAKPCKKERAAVPHHLLDIIDPDESYSIALYQRSALQTITDIHCNGRTPFLVGGSGQYIWSVLEGWKIPAVIPNPAFRESLEESAWEHGVPYLYGKLEKIDPIAAKKILPNNLRRIIRALEIYEQTGVKPSDLQVKAGLPYPMLIIGFTTQRQMLYSLIDSRVEKMIEAGLIEEVRSLISMGYSPDLPSMSSLGYSQISMYLKGESTLEDAVQKIKHETHRFARNQYAWFHLNDDRIKWFDISNSTEDKIDYTIETFLSCVQERLEQAT